MSLPAVRGFAYGCRACLPSAQLCRDAVVTKGEFFRDETERTQRLRSSGRRRGRLRRKSTYFGAILGFMILLIAAAPSIVCQSPIARNLISSTLPNYGFEGGVQSVRIGWLTPLRIDGLELTGAAAGTHLKVESVETAITLVQAMRGLSDLGEISVRGVLAEVFVTDGRSSVEDDLVLALADDDSSSGDEAGSDLPGLTGKITTQDITVHVTDQVTKQRWSAEKLQADLQLDHELADVNFSTVLTDSAGGSGEIEGRLQYPLAGGKPYQLNLVTQRTPLSLASLAKRRLGESGASIPSQIGGDVTGSMTIEGGVGDTISVSLSPMEFRNFVASDPSLGERVWRNGLTVVSGAATLEDTRIVGRKLLLTTDFGSASFDGAFNTSLSLAGDANPAAWLEALDGSAGVSIDLVAFERAMPGLIPLRDQAEISAGGLSAEISSAFEAGNVRRSHWNLKTQPIRANAAGRTVVIEPATLVASIRVADGELAADTVRLESSFASATVEGDLSRGRLTGDIQFGRLASMIQPLLDMPELSLAGQTTAEMTWAAEAGDVWRLQGKANATDLVLALPGGISLQQPAISGDVDATGRWTAGSLGELSSLMVRVITSGLEATADLTAPVANPSATTPLPLRLSSRGRLEALAALLGPWMPESIHTLQGGYTADALAAIALSSGEIVAAKLQVEEPRVGYGEQLYVQPQLVVDFDGRYAWPDGELDAKKLTIVGDALSAAVQGSITPMKMNMEVAWRAKLDRLHTAVRPSLAKIPGNIQGSGASVGNTQPVAFRGAAPPPSSSYAFAGDCDGRIKISQSPESSIMRIESSTSASDLTIIDPQSMTTTVGPPRAKTVWTERSLNLDALLEYDTKDGQVNAEKLQLVTDWLATTLKGKALWNEAVGDVAIGGTARVKMPAVATQLTTLLGTPVRLEGIHETPIEMVAARQGTGPVALAINTTLGWEAGEVAGVRFGLTEIPIAVNETTVSVKPATIPVEQGRLQLAGDLHYSPGPIWASVRPGVVAENIRLTPELTSQWLQYLAPMAANATRIEGTFGIELAEAIVNLDQPMGSKVRGSLRINGINMDSGPVANQLISSVKQIQQLVRGGAAEPVTVDSKRLVTFPAQSVDFEFVNGVVSHQRMFMEIDRARIITSGQVHADQRINLVTQVPLDPSWLGSDLKGLAGKTVTLPITGTLSRPTLDAAAIRSLVTELGTKALQTTAESYLEKQIGRGFEKLLGR